jgi:hypothetical protein
MNLNKLRGIPMRQGLGDYVSNLIHSSLKGNDSRTASQLQRPIHPEILFRYNTINLLVARRGIGKTFTVMRELIKLSQLPNYGGYTTFLYATDKTNDETVNQMIKLIKLKVRQVSYVDLLPVLRDLIDAKNAYADVLDKGAMDYIDEESMSDIFSTLDITGWQPKIPPTVILLDDAINILKDNKYKEVRNLLFQSRQPRLTVFICVQDIFGLPVQLRRNCDTIFLFAGMTDKMAFGMMMSQLGINNIVKWNDYQQIPYRGVVVVDYLPDGIKIKVSIP